MIAYLNQGRWVVHCPNPGCLSASAVPPGMPLTWCECRDGTVCDHGPAGCQALITIVWPAELEAIIAATAIRPRVNQNWLPGEPVEQLLAENDIYMGSR